MLIDSHAHLTSSSIYEEVEAVLERARLAGIGKILNIATDLDSLEKGLLLQKSYPWVFNAAATHPHDVEARGESDFEWLESYAADLKAIGETGLDYFYENSPKETQKKILVRTLDLAQRKALPVVIHCREAFADFFDILSDFKAVKGVLHCFTGTRQEAEKVMETGFYLSLSGIVTFKKSTALQEIAKWVPLDRLLLETDAPFLAPQSKRGKPNEPAFVAETARFIANLRAMPFEALAEATTTNAEKLFQF